MQAEEAAQQESAAAGKPSRPRPPTAVLGFAPLSQASPSPTPAFGNHSWPPHFFDNSKKKRICQAADSEQESVAASGHQDESGDTGAVSSRMGNGDSMAGDGLDKDFGAAWRDAAQSPVLSQSPAPVPETGQSGCLRQPHKFSHTPEFLLSCCVVGCLTDSCQQFVICNAASCMLAVTSASAASSSTLN